MCASRNAWIGGALLSGLLLCIAGCATPNSKPPLSSQAQAEALSHFSLGLLAERSGDSEAALDHLSRAIRIDPGEPILYPPAIAVAMQLEQGAEALRLCRNLRKQHPDSLPPLLMEAQVCTLIKRDEDAEALFRQATLDFPDQPDSLLAFARFLISKERNPEAIQLLKPEQTQHENNGPFTHMLGTLIVEQAQTITNKLSSRSTLLDGIALLERSLGILPDHPQIWQQLGYAYLAANEPDKARNAFEKAYALYPSDILIARPLLDLCIQSGELARALELCEEVPRHTRTAPELWFQYLRKRLPEEQQEPLAKELQTYLQQHPQAPVLYYVRLSSLYLDLDRIPEAEAVLEEAAIRFPDDNRLNIITGYVCLRQKKYEDAYTTFRQIQKDLATDDWVSNPFFTFNLMVSAQKTGRHEEAAKTLASAYTEDPAILSQTMQALLAEDAPLSGESAIELLHTFRTLTPDATETLYYLSLLQAAEEEYETALNHAQEFERLAAGTETNLLNGFFYYQYAVLHERSGHLSEAEEIFQKTIEVGSPVMAASAQNAIAYMWAERGEQLETGLVLIQKALGAEPDNASFIDTLGWIYYMQGRYQEALDTLKKANSLLENDPVIWEHMGDTYLKLGDISSAVKHWEKALEILPDEERLIQRLEEHRLRPDGHQAPADNPADTPRHP